MRVLLLKYFLFAWGFIVLLAPQVWAKEGASQGSSYECRDRGSFSSNESYLKQLGSEIDNSLSKLTAKKTDSEMLILLQRVLCYHQIHGDLMIYETLQPFLKTGEFKKAQERLSLQQQETLTQSIKDLNSSPE